jgi:hypothetical protein
MGPWNAGQRIDPHLDLLLLVPLDRRCGLLCRVERPECPDDENGGEAVWMTRRAYARSKRLKNKAIASDRGRKMTCFPTVDFRNLLGIRNFDSAYALG